MIPDYDGEKKYPREEIHWSDNFDSWKDWLASQDGDLESDDSMARAKCDETSVEALSRKSCKNKDLREKEKKSLTGVE